MFLFFDTETTGIPLNYRAPVTDLDNWPRVVQLAFLVTDGGPATVKSGEFLIRPEGFTIPAEAARVHGITTGHAVAHGVAIADALAAFLECLGSATALVAHNMAYDENVLGAEFLRAGLANPLPRMKRFCTMQSGTDFCRLPAAAGRRGFKWPTLGELHAKLFSRPLEKAHAALADVQTCARCFFEMRKRGLIGR